MRRDYASWVGRVESVARPTTREMRRIVLVLLCLQTQTPVATDAEASEGGLVVANDVDVKETCQVLATRIRKA